MNGKKSIEGKLKEESGKITSQDNFKNIQIQKISAELALVQAKLKAVQAEQQAKEVQLHEVRDKQESENINYADVLQHQQREQENLQGRIRELEQRLHASNHQLFEIRAALDTAQIRAAAAEKNAADCLEHKTQFLLTEEKDEKMLSLQSAVVHLQEQLELSQQCLFAALEQLEFSKCKAMGVQLCSVWLHFVMF